MGIRTNISKIASNFWVDLLESNREKMALKDPRLNEKYALRDWKQSLENFGYEMQLYVKLFFPKHDRLLLINCIGNPCSDLKIILDRNKIDLAFIQGEIIEMEVSSNKLMVFNRKENTATCLYERKSLFDEQSS